MCRCAALHTVHIYKRAGQRRRNGNGLILQFQQLRQLGHRPYFIARRDKTHHFKHIRFDALGAHLCDQFRRDLSIISHSRQLAQLALQRKQVCPTAFHQLRRSARGQNHSQLPGFFHSKPLCVLRPGLYKFCRQPGLLRCADQLFGLFGELRLVVFKHCAHHKHCVFQTLHQVAKRPHIRLVHRGRLQHRQFNDAFCTEK